MVGLPAKLLVKVLVLLVEPWCVATTWWVVEGRPSGKTLADQVIAGLA